MNLFQGKGHELLGALQLADSFFPTGSYAHSQGLEGMVAMGWVRNSEELGVYLASLLAEAIIPSDGVALLQANEMSAKGDLQTLITIDGMLYAMKLPEETRRASVQSGRRVLDETHGLIGPGDVPKTFSEYRAAVARGEAPGSGAVAFGVSAWAQGIGAETALLAFCHAFAVGVLGSGQRLLPVTHAEAQSILRSLHIPVIAGAAAIKDLHWRDMTSFTPWADIASMRHETADLRMFAS